MFDLVQTLKRARTGIAALGKTPHLTARYLTLASCAGSYLAECVAALQRAAIPTAASLEQALLANIDTPHPVHQMAAQALWRMPGADKQFFEWLDTASTEAVLAAFDKAILRGDR